MDTQAVASTSEQAADNRGIRIRRDTTVSVEGDRRQADDQRPSQTTTTIGSEQSKSPSRSQDAARPQTFCVSPSSPDINSSSFLSDRSEHDQGRTTSNANERERETARDLIDFLRNTPPPARNFMSTPGAFDGNAEKIKRRHSFWPFRKKAKKESTTRPASDFIRLPDSAVVGRTTGGHQHVAISIPVEHAHLTPPTREPVSSPATPPSEPVSILKQAKDDTPESPRSKARAKRATFPSHDDRFSLLWNPNDSLTQLHNAQLRDGAAEPPRPSLLADTLVGAHSMNATSAPELTAQEGPVSPADLVTSGEPGRAGSPGRQPSVQSRHTADYSSPPDQPLVGEWTSPRQSIGTSSSESICSDAVTFDIPSPQLPGKHPESPCPQEPDAEAPSFSASEFGQSSLTVPSPNTAGGTGSSEYSPEQSPRASNQSSVEVCEAMDNADLAHHAPPGSRGVYQSRTLGDIITSLESLLPRPPSSSPHTLQITPVMTVVDIPPSTSIDPSSQDQAISPDPPATKDDDICPPPLPISTNPTPTPTLTPTPTPHRPISRSPSHTSLLRRYADLRHMADAHFRELTALQARVEELEDTGRTWPDTLTAMFGGIAEGMMARPAMLYRGVKALSGSAAVSSAQGKRPARVHLAAAGGGGGPRLRLAEARRDDWAGREEGEAIGDDWPRLCLEQEQEQQQQQVEVDADSNSNSSSSGWTGLESVMRDLIISVGDEPVGSRTSEDPDYGRWLKLEWL
ncbi:hypothetical protein BT67DRAFT_478513 [Trichocladium antarcticum]|uniref:Uncharacterized protein n=1 Tax=Trichocladium antarcticum TaxID=1450529 RepID=A0AAN6ZBV6_9PEZI|nr:hypothetical protein BT67DRAFT_478513 [Trichocladium antarcticum]